MGDSPPYRDSGVRTYLRLTAAFVLVLAGAVQAAAAPVVTGVRMGEQTGATRLVLDLSEAVPYSVFALDNPYRVVIDLPVVDWRQTGGYGPVGVIEGLRHGRFDAETSRIVLDLSGPVEVARSFVLPPEGPYAFRLVVDLKPVGSDAFVRLQPPPGPPPVPAPAIASQRPRGLPVVAIDAGHGGIDPGAIGANGVFEKDITLAIARELRAALEATGRYQVILTRNDDHFLALRQRVGIARDAGAELFVSLHADSVAQSSVRGASVYTLSSSASDKEAESLAARENRADIIGGLDLAQQSSDVAAILISLAQRESMNLSANFANLLIPEFSRDWRLLNNTHRFAGFAVLKAPDVPSVLVEMGYLSNRADEQALSQASTRRPLVEAMVRGIDEYFLHHGG